MQLMILYQISDNVQKICYEWQRVETKEKDKIFSKVIDFIKSLPGWENSSLYGVRKLSEHEPLQEVIEAFFKQRKKDNSNSEIKHLKATYYICEGDEFITRKEFCQSVDVFLKNTDPDIQKFFREFALDPETTDHDIKVVMDTMLEKLFSVDENITQ